MSFAGGLTERNRYQLGSGPPLGVKQEEIRLSKNGQTAEPTYVGWKERIRDEILDVGIACSKEGWDGEDAAPISADAVGRAWNLIYLAPDMIRPPEIAPSADGEIAFEWRRGRDRILSLVPHKDDIIFSAILGPINNRENGCKPLKNGWPVRVTELLLEYFSYVDPASLRTR
jgi:hypothetical protein